jgi:tRNA pseudouridine55 synthase
MDGIFLVNKPEGLTSNRVVQHVKRLVRPAKVGHSGTLDPAATGLLVILIGAATRALDYLGESRKEYVMTVKLGEETDTEDKEGDITATADAGHVTQAQITDVLTAHLGVQDQTPPRYSAIKKNGVPLYKMARRGETVDPEPRKIEIFALELLGWEPPFLNLRMACSKGTYARALARDIGQDLGVGGRLEALTRTASGRFRLESAVDYDDLEARGTEAIRENLIDVATSLGHIPTFSAQPNELKRLLQGSHVVLTGNRLFDANATNDAPERLFKVVSPDGSLVILVRPQPMGNRISLRPVRVFKAS